MNVFHKVANELNGYVLGRKEQIEIALTCLLANQHYAVVGAPGTAKSLMFTCLAQHFTDAEYFQVTVDRATPKDDLFGPVSVQGLKEDDLRRNTSKRLPEAHIAFIDEAFKASSATLNAMLTILNERMYENGRKGLQKVPLISAFAASNEYPGDDGGDSVSALWDRFLMRSEVGYLDDDDALAMLSIDSEYQPQTIITIAELQDAIREVKRGVNVPNDIKMALVQVRRLLRDEHGVTISDRRLRCCMSILSAHAYLNGRDTVVGDDMMILQHCLWENRDERAAIASVLMRSVDPYLVEVSQLIEEANAQHQLVKQDPGVRAEADMKLQAAKRRLKELTLLASTDVCREKASAGFDAINKILQQMVVDLMGDDMDFSISRG